MSWEDVKELAFAQLPEWVKDFAEKNERKVVLAFIEAGEYSVREDPETGEITFIITDKISHDNEG